MGEDRDDDILNPLEMSDEEMMELPDPDFEDLEEENTNINEEENENGNETTEENEEEESNEDGYSDDDNENASEAKNPDKENEVATTDDEDDADDSDEDDSADSDTFDDSDESDDEEEQDNDTKTSNKKEKEVDNSIDYEAEYNKVFAPFRANGRDVQVENADQAIRLMQMGAGFNAKMAGLKPSLKLLKMLENNGLNTEDKINQLIDLDKKNPAAITKLIKDSGIDPLELDIEKETEYRPNSYKVNDNQVELDGVLAEIEHTDSYANTIDVISKQWDEASQSTLAKNPSTIRDINDQIASGVYKQIDDVVKHQRMLGKLTEYSDIDAYRVVGTYMQENRLFKGQSQAPEQPKAVVPMSKKKTSPDPKLKSRKKAASGTRTATKQSKRQDYNPLSLSDEEFEKVSTPQI
jgi:hypothetical protein